MADLSRSSRTSLTRKLVIRILIIVPPPKARPFAANNGRFDRFQCYIVFRTKVFKKIKDRVWHGTRSGKCDQPSILLIF